jgi:hypothetical protein
MPSLYRYAVVGCELHVAYSEGGRGIKLATFEWAALGR